MPAASNGAGAAWRQLIVDGHEPAEAPNAAINSIVAAPAMVVVTPARNVVKCIRISPPGNSFAGLLHLN
jgi:hypothetical protein